MGWVDSLQTAINFMEEHLLDKISIEDIAKEAASSPFHFQRTFAILTDTTVGEYIRRRRLTLAAQDLMGTRAKVIDIALKFGYDTPEAFTKAFRKQHGITPTEARKGIGKLHSYNRLIIQVSLKGVDPMRYRIVEKDAFKVVGVKRPFSLVNDENLVGIPKFWEDVHTDGTSDKLFQINNGEVKGVLGICVDKSDAESKQMDYWIATDYNGDGSDNYSNLEIPASKWVVFEVHGAMPDAIQNMWKKIYSEWFPSSGFEPAGTPDLEVYPEGNPNSSDYYSEIWIPIK